MTCGNATPGDLAVFTGVDAGDGPRTFSMARVLSGLWVGLAVAATTTGRSTPIVRRVTLVGPGCASATAPVSFLSRVTDCRPVFTRLRTAPGLVALNGGLPVVAEHAWMGSLVGR